MAFHSALKLPRVEAETLAISSAPAWIWEMLSASEPRVPLGTTSMLMLPLEAALTSSAKEVS